MNEVIENICDDLDSLGQTVEDGWNDASTKITEMYSRTVA